jgi:hypothetical protein
MRWDDVLKKFALLMLKKFEYFPNLKPKNTGYINLVRTGISCRASSKFLDKMQYSQ